MNGYLIERLFPTGWRRDGQIYWRFADAMAEAERSLSEDLARGIRVLVVRVQPDAVVEQMADRQEVPRG